MEGAVITAFGGGVQETPAETRMESGAGTLTTQEPQVNGSAWESAYDGLPELKEFAAAKEGDPTAWQYDYAKLAKVLGDRRSHISKQDEVIKGLREAHGEVSIPDSVDDYLNGFDHEALKAAAGRAYLGRGESGANVSEQAFFEAMRQAGVPVDRARHAFSGFMTTLHGHVPEEKTAQERLDEAVKGMGPNGRQQLEDVNAWVGQQHSRNAFTEGEQAILDEMMRTTHGLSALWRMSRASGAGVPPDSQGAAHGDVLSLDEIRAAMRSDRYRNDEAYRKRITDAYGHLSRGQGETSSHFSKTLSLGG